MNPLVEGDRLQAFRLLYNGLPRLMAEPENATLRIDLCTAAFLENRAADDGTEPPSDRYLSADHGWIPGELALPEAPTQHDRVARLAAFVVRGEEAPERFKAPQPQLFAIIIEGILGGELEWGLVITGVLIAVAMELMGIGALPVAVGMYPPGLLPWRVVFTRLTVPA